MVTEGVAEFEPGGAVRQVIGAIRDVTELRLAVQRLIDCEARFQELARNTSDILVRTSVDGRLEYISPAAEPVIGYRPGALVAGWSQISSWSRTAPDCSRR